MMLEFSWPDRDSEVMGVVLIVTVAYCVFHYFTSAKSYRARHRADPELTEEALEIRAWVFQRLSGLGVLGLVPALLAWILFGIAPHAMGLAVGDVGLAALLSGILVVVLLPLLYVAAKQPAQQAMLPQMRLERWTGGRLRLSAGTWMAYLFGYELFFRGVLLFSLARWAGPWPAIIISTGFYTWAHLPKAAGETLGCVLMGVVFGASALATGAIWSPFLVHVVIAVSSERFAIASNPRMSRV